jgi:small subunit ribosomal protein S20
MANIKSAVKRHRKSLEQRDSNRSQRSRMRTAIKELRTAVVAGENDRARELLGTTLQVIDVTARKGLIHRNTAARYQSRLSQAIAGLKS